MLNILIIILIVVVVAFGLAILRKLKGSQTHPDEALTQLYEKNEQQRLQHKTEVDHGIREMLGDSQQKIDLIVRQLREQLTGSQTDIKSLKEQNSALREHLNQSLEATRELKVSTEGLKSLLSNNRLRGDWGEQIAEDLLLAAGFVENVNFVKQRTTDSGRSRPDFTILLPDGTKLNVDAKFPLDNLIAYQEATVDADKKRALLAFKNAVKEQVRQVSTRDYINPEEQTVDFVVMFVPNEMIFSYIYEQMPDIQEYASQRKVILAGPFGFTALVRLVLQAYKNFQYEKGLHQILGLIEKFRSEYDKFGDSLVRLGSQIETTRKTFDDIEGTRNRQLTRVVDKISEYSKQDGLPSDDQDQTLGLGEAERAEVPQIEE